MTRPVGATVVVCAYTERRLEQLVAALTEAAAQGPEQLLLVIDHNDRLFERATALDIPGLEVVTNERRQGLSGARNTGVARARADVVVFLDDDATPEAGWLDALLAPYADPRVVGVGGAATPVWPAEGGRPRTLPAPPGAAHGELDWVVGCTFVGQPTTLSQVRNPMGCNMSLRRSAFGVGGFSESLGRVGTVPLGCEETELSLRVTAAHPEDRIVFEPRARVRHHVSADRRTWRYLLRRGYAEGISKAAVSALAGRQRSLSTETSYATRVLPRGAARELSRGNVEGAAAIVSCLAATAFGYVRGLPAARRLEVTPPAVPAPSRA